ncbi:hypothetical protein LPUS_08646 [Lasallia pustulata]|uniref:Uncharacterized protein n=1 Tax=Lasallia pustulata TaxID=136370 RepID=A0A1W5D5N8_9LECA|nr:hypothetical protein LPUS_08646 [Lasallia pustulata]
MEALTKEVRRIVASPYAVSLKNLHDILRDADQYTIQRWAYCNECYIDALAAAVLEALQLWPYTLEIVRDLSCIVSFRDALLLQKPLLLDTLLKKAIASPDGDSQHAAACVAMLTTPLPGELPAPASLPSFFLTKLESAVEAPSALTIRPIHSLLAGVGSTLLDVLPAEATSRLHEQLSRMLQSLQDRPAILLCLAIFASVLSGSSPVCKASETSSQNLHSAMPGEAVLPDEVRRHQNIRKYFNERRASKTLDLVVLGVIEACSSSFSLNCCEAVESLGLAQEIVRVVNCDERVGWLKKSGSKTRKLFEKVLRQDTKAEVRLAALEFIVSLVEIDQIPNEIVTSFQDLSLQQLAKPPSAWMVEKLASRFDECFICTQLLGALRLSTMDSCCDNDVLVELGRAQSLVPSLSSAVPGSQQLRQMILYSLSSNKFSEPLARFQSRHLPAHRSTSSHDLPNICSTRFGNLQRSLSQKLCSLFLRTALLANAEEVSIDASLAGALIDKQVSIGSTQEACQTGLSYRVNRMGQLSLFEAGSSPAHATASHDWRIRLADELRRDATHQHDTVVRIVNEVCRDLEERCEVAEQPLLEEQARSADLWRRLKNSEKKLAEAENEQQERTLVLAGMESEKDSLALQVQVAEQCLQDFSKELDKMHQDINQAKQEAKRAAEASQETEKQRELEHLAKSTAKDEVIEQQNVIIRSAETHAQALEEQIEDLRSQNSDSQNIIGRLQSLVDERTIEVAELKASAVSNGEEISRLRTVETSLEADNQILRSELHEARVQHEAVTLQHQDRCTILEKEKSRLQQDHNQYKSEKSDEIAKQQIRHDRGIEALQNEVAQASKAAASYARKQNATVSELQKKLDLLIEERKERAREFAQAQELSSKLMAVMGARTGQSDAYQKEDFSLKGAKIPPPEDPVSEEVDRGSSDTENTKSFGSSASSKSEPTPKRSKPRRSFKSPFLQRSDTCMGFKSAKSTHGGPPRAKRQPLKDIGVGTQDQRNSTPSEPSQKLGKCLINNDNSLALDEVDVGDLSFEGSNIFTSTAREGTQVLRSRIPQKIYDETTTEF